jgi:hypothetical protein
MQGYFVGRNYSSPTVGSKFVFVLCGGHDPAGDLPHMFAGIGKLASQKLRLNLHRLLKVGGMNQLSRMLERGLHVLLGER